MIPIFLTRIPLKVYAFAGIAIFALALFAAYSYQKDRADKAEARAQTEAATSSALDTAATKIDATRAEQQEKQADVDKIQGSDQRLPDGYGARLECVRRGVECKNP